MPEQLTLRQSDIRSTIEAFIAKRLQTKLEKLDADAPERAALSARFDRAAWLADAARRADSIKVVTHSLKPIHPEAKGTSLFCPPVSLVAHAEMGSHSLGDQFDRDATGSAASLDVFAFLSLTYEEDTLLDLAIKRDADFGVAMTSDPALAKQWMTAFAGLVQPPDRFSSHKHAKQIFWHVGADPHDDANYHLLAPLCPVSLVERVYRTVHADRFDEEAKAARKARRAGEWHARAVHEYPDLATLKLGGTKPQNVGHLNSKRSGTNYLLASLPPVWHLANPAPLLSTVSLFRVYVQRRRVRALARSLLGFLEGGPDRTAQTRARRDELVNALLDELIQFTAEIRQLEPGWSADARCRLPVAHCAWLDPDGAPRQEEASNEKVAEVIARQFAEWLNAYLHDPLPMSDPECRHWLALANEQLSEFAEV